MTLCGCRSERAEDAASVQALVDEGARGDVLLQRTCNGTLRVHSAAEQAILRSQVRRHIQSNVSKGLVGTQRAKSRVGAIHGFCSGTGRGQISSTDCRRDRAMSMRHVHEIHRSRAEETSFPFERLSHASKL